MSGPAFSLSRFLAVFLKEMVQMRRDRLTFAIMIAVPVMQLILFGYAINTDPRHMPTVVELREDGPLSRAMLAGMRASSYFDITGVAASEEEGDRMLRDGRATFVVVIPEGFERRLMRGERPEILIAADATDPTVAAGAAQALEEIARRALSLDFERTFARRAEAPAPFSIVVHRRFNPEGVTALNIVPGLLGVILTLTLVLITSIALTREAERGTMEFLLSTPVRASEVMLGKITPYVLVGVTQVALVLLLGAVLFRVPFTGSPFAFALGVSVFILANLMLGYLISTVARTQMQAMQLTFFMFLPSILLSGFMFPFAAMPAWARALGEALPITHFLRIVRRTMLKGAGLPDIAGEAAALVLILAILSAAALLRYRRTLD